ncbi:pro-neuregulin-1, membrane-bound isoform isoform X1 [Arapaima gigas]
MRGHRAAPVLCWICASLSVHLAGARSSSLTCAPPPPAAASSSTSTSSSSVQELVHRAGVVVEGKLHEEGRESDINQQEREALLRARGAARGAASRTASELPDPGEQVGGSLPNGSSGSELSRVRVRVHQVWEVKAGGLEKNSVVSLIWTCPLKRGTRYMFFMEPTNDTSVFHAVFPPVETRRSVRRNATQVLCQGCAPVRRFGRRARDINTAIKRGTRPLAQAAERDPLVPVSPWQRELSTGCGAEFD